MLAGEDEANKLDQILVLQRAANRNERFSIESIRIGSIQTLLTS